MTISASDGAATLAYLVPGFVALTVFYWFGVQIKRPDWQWVIWSLIATVPIALAASWIAGLFDRQNTDLTGALAECGVRDALGITAAPAFRDALEGCASEVVAAHNAGWELAIGIAIAVVAGFVAVQVWKLAAARWPQLSSRTELMAWQGALARGSRWLEVKTADGVYSGYNREVASPVETEDLDLYLGAPAILRAGDPEKGQADKWEELPGVEGMLLKRDDIEWIKVREPKKT